MFNKKTRKLDYRIKLLSGNNVVLVEANGFESEIFMPEILNGRISFQNIIPNRRCCFLSNSSLNSKTGSGYLRAKKRRMLNLADQQPEESGDNALLTMSNSTKIWRMNGGHDRSVTPLARSTPAPAPSPVTSDTYHHSKNKENMQPRARINSQYYKTSDLIRSNVPTPNQVIKDTRVQIPSGIKVIRLYRSQGGKDSLLSPLRHSNYELPPTPTMSGTPNKRRANPTEGREASPDSGKITTPGSITKWRKCLTPVRTYSRRAIPVQRQSSASSIKKLRNNLKMVPSNGSNGTQGIKGTQKVEVRKRRLLIDPKVTISPTSFKQQQQQQKQRSGQRRSPSRPSLRVSKNADSKMSAFDMLTRSNRARNMSSKLDQQFKKSCVNKATSTCPKYKILCTIPSPSSKKSKTALQKQRPLSPVSALTAAAMLEKTAQKTSASNNNSSATTVATPQTHSRWS